jgi:hypothetical protein
VVLLQLAEVFCCRSTCPRSLWIGRPDRVGCVGDGFGEGWVG